MTARYEPTLILAWSGAAAALSFGDIQHPIRSALVLGFLAFVPGLALVRLLGLQGALPRLLLALPTSLALTAIVSGVLAYGSFPNWELGFSVLLALAIGAVVLDVARRPLAAPRVSRRPRTKLDDDARQAALIQALSEGGTLADAARAAGVSVATLRRALRTSPRLRMAVSVTSQAGLDDDPDCRPGVRPLRR